MKRPGSNPPPPGSKPILDLATALGPNATTKPRKVWLWREHLAILKEDWIALKEAERDEHLEEEIADFVSNRRD